MSIWSRIQSWFDDSDNPPATTRKQTYTPPARPGEPGSLDRQSSQAGAWARINAQQQGANPLQANKAQQTGQIWNALGQAKYRGSDVNAPQAAPAPPAAAAKKQGPEPTPLTTEQPESQMQTYGFLGEGSPQSTGDRFLDWLLGRGEHAKPRQPEPPLGSSRNENFRPAGTTKPTPEALATASTPTRTPEQQAAINAARDARAGLDLRASDPVYQLLARAGWGAPQRYGAEPSLAGLDMSKAVDLDPYNYRVSPEEWKQIQQTYRGTKNYQYAPSYANPDYQPPVLTSEVVRAAPMTWDAYNALSDAQRAAVDFNTLLVEARQADIGSKLDATQQGEADEISKRLFGEGHGSDTRAPAVLRLLDNLGYKAQGQDLDEYLSLDRAITTDELANFDFSKELPINLMDVPTMSTAGGKPAPAGTNYGLARGLDNLSRVDTANIKAAGSYIDQLMSSPGTSLGELPAAAKFAATGARPETIPAGYGLEGELKEGTPEFAKDTFWKTAYSFVSDRANTDPTEFWSQVQSHNFTDQDLNELMGYLDTRATNEPGGRTPDEIRALLEGGG